MYYPAHIRTNPAMEKVQHSVGEHCRGSAENAVSKAAPEIANVVRLAALLHDMGKYTAQFKEYIEKAADGIDVRRGSVNHTFAGVRFAMEQWHTSSEQSFENMTAELIAFAIGSHHGQFDFINPKGENGYSHRTEKEGISYSEAKEQFLNQCVDEAELNRLFSLAVDEVTAIFKCCEDIAFSSDELFFYMSLFARRVLSLVIDGDRTDTISFMHGLKTNCSRDIKTLWSREFDHLERVIGAMSNDGSEINRVRKIISDQCCNSTQSAGVFRLSVPTGGGKTLTSLRYAVTAAKKHGKKRIFFVIPLLTVLEQNAKVIRDSIEDDGIVLEHHSNIINEASSDDNSELREHDLLTDTWDSPIVVTTMVQLLNTLFSGKTSAIRRMNSLADSVLIIDEVQNVPIKLLSLFNLAVSFLSETCNANVILCSATQPCLEKVKHAVRYSKAADLVTLTPIMQNVFRRTKIIDRRLKGGYTAEQLADFSIACMEDEGNALIICNTKAQARQIYDFVRDKKVKAFHLSTSMCTAHRRATLEEIDGCLKGKERFVCVSTQLVEAGVDISFGCVIRLSAGLDNVVQAAGRCNRNGEYGKIQPVYIVDSRDENLKYLTEIKKTKDAAESVLLMYERDPENYQNDLLSASAISEYYRRLYTDLREGETECSIEVLGSTLYSMMSDNQLFVGKNRDPIEAYFMMQSLKTAGEEFTVFDDDTRDILVPYGEGVNLIAELASESMKYDFEKKKALLHRAKAYTISLYSYEIQKLNELRGIFGICGGSILVLQSDFYQDDRGFSMEGFFGAGKFLED